MMMTRLLLPALLACVAAPAFAQNDVPEDTELQTTASGLQYSVLKKGPGTGDSPKMGDKVKVHYTGWLTNGKKFDSSVDRGQPASFPLDGVIAGWTEGVATMMVGGKRKLVIPYGLAYGAAGRAPMIPPRATLVFDIELLSTN